jgi:hypothetical protein
MAACRPVNMAGFPQDNTADSRQVSMEVFLRGNTADFPRASMAACLPASTAVCPPASMAECRPGRLDTRVTYRLGLYFFESLRRAGTISRRNLFADIFLSFYGQRISFSHVFLPRQGSKELTKRCS